MSFEGQAAAAGVVALPIVALAAVAAGGVLVAGGLTYAAIKGSAFVTRGLIRNARDARRAWQEQAARAREEAREEARREARTRIKVRPQEAERQESPVRIRLHQDLAAVRAEAQGVERDAVMSVLAGRDRSSRLQEALARAEAAPDATLKEAIDDAERALGQLREEAFQRLGRLQRDYVSERVSEALGSMGYGRPGPVDAGSWTVLYGSNGRRPFTVAVTDDLRLVFDLGHDGAPSLDACQKEVRRFLDSLAGTVELERVEMQPNTPQAAQEQAALTLLRMLRQMNAALSVDQDGDNVILTATVAGRRSHFAVGPDGSTSLTQTEEEEHEPEAQAGPLAAGEA